MNFKLSILLFMLLALNSFGQTYKKAKLYLDSHQILKVNNLTINSDDATFFNSATNKQETVALDEINLIKQAKGSHYLEGALYGAGVGVLTALIVDIQPDDPFGVGVERDHGLGFYLGVTTGGAALGALVGLLFPKWKTVYSGGKFIGFNFPVSVDLISDRDLLNLKITMTL